MSSHLTITLDGAVAEARGLDAPLSERLRLIADRVRDLSAPYAEAVDVFVGRLGAAKAGTSAPQVGDVMPDFMLPDQDGRMVTLDGLLHDGPAVVVFHRGHWCPYCRATMSGMAEIEQRIAPGRMVAISPERQLYTRLMRSDAGAGFPFLSDVGSGYALSIDLAIWVDDAMAGLLAAADIQVPDYQGTAGWIMPIPAVFVVGTDGTVLARHVDPDYRSRMELSDVLDAFEHLHA
jgi:peroxiredoxin